MKKAIGSINVAACGSGDFMPCMRSVAQDKAYSEPTRDRDKDWMELSGRRIRNQEISNNQPDIEEQDETAVQFGRYKPNEGLGSLMWASVEGSAISMSRSQRIDRKCMVISETKCIVSIYGMGIQGRLISGQPSLITIDCYSIWNSERHKIELDDKEIMKVLIMAGKASCIAVK